MNSTLKEKKAEVKRNSAAHYPGADVDLADNEKDTPRLVKERLKIQDDNPESHMGPNPFEKGGE